MRIKLKGINKVRKTLADGTVAQHYYHRRTRTKLQGEPGSPQFLASYNEAERKPTRPPEGDTLSGLIRQYCESQQWTKLADSTKEIGRLNLKAVEDKWGATPLQHVQNRKIRPLLLRWHDKLAAEYPRAADNKLAALQRVLSWARNRGLIELNPLDTFERAYRSDRAEIIWLPEHVAAFNAVAAPELRLALSLAIHTGQRQGDLLRLPWSAWDGEAIALRQGKGRRRMWIPGTDALIADLAAAPRRATTILTKPDGTSWTKDAFYNAWVAAFALSGINADLHFHDLRGTAVTMLSEAGCTPQEIATITGHTIANVHKILETYLARTRDLARGAIVKLNAHRRNARPGNVG
ncbi:tyrosine-type recombinase/integrase [Methylobacterium sp. E-041]|uniref:tyrosine-type recombinase/integrase n=1 Tax=Methylobacterium sp. E-041 TaxID=2836573 RepID=UPI001FBC0545|nr:tyrosine-type recombinase/integrase [Methylobacterium sp. E-041]MCJ2105642.1 tyrosine-type recombinase/integrase [Methylobacterium sp. E-041]